MSQLSNPAGTKQDHLDSLKNSIKNARANLSMEELNIRDSIESVERGMVRTQGNNSLDRRLINSQEMANIQSPEELKSGGGHSRINQSQENNRTDSRHRTSQERRAMNQSLLSMGSKAGSQGSKKAQPAPPRKSFRLAKAF